MKKFTGNYLTLFLFLMGCLLSKPVVAKKEDKKMMPPTTVLYVNKDGDGMSCTRYDPCGSIQMAIDMAHANATIIQVSGGVYQENLVIPAGKDGLMLERRGKKKAIIESAGGVDGVQAPPGVPLDAILDIFSPNVFVEGLTFRHPKMMNNMKRDVAIFVRPPARDVTIYDVTVERLRSGEPTVPGSRGLLVFRATGTKCSDSVFEGPYEDHIHLPTSGAVILENKVDGASRLGIAVIQENESSLSIEVDIFDNLVTNSAVDGIQIQGDNNMVIGNTIKDSGAYGLHLCGPGSGCVPPGGNADTVHNVARRNRIKDSGVENIGNFGSDNSVETNKSKGGKKRRA